jgi:hypothetical protein
MTHKTGAIPRTTRNIAPSRQAITQAAKSICPTWTMLTKNTSWMPTRNASTSEVTRLIRPPTFMRWKKAIGMRCTVAKISLRRALTTVSPTSSASR